MRRSYLECFFRHKWLLSLPVIITLVVALGYAFSLPRSFEANGTVWSDSRIPSDSTIGTTGGSEVPALGQQAALTELIASRSFLSAVANNSPYRAQVSNRPPLEAEASLATLASSITVTTAGPHVVRVSVKQKSPEMAIGLANAVMTQFTRAQSARLQARAEAQAAFDKKQLDAATRSLNQSKSGTTARTQSNAAGGSQAGSASAAQQYSDAAKAYNDSLAAASEGDDTALTVLDKATEAYPQSRKKAILFGGVGGLLAGLSLSLMGLVLLMARDRSVRDEGQLEKTLGLTVAGTVAELSPPRRQLEQVHARRRALSGGS